MTKIHELTELGQSIWLDYIRRAFIESGEMAELIEAGIRGVTSNPAIFEKAIAGSADYDSALRKAAASRDATEDQDITEIYETLAIDDIQQAADLLRPVYERSRGADGFVSLEVNPSLAYDTGGTVSEARRLFATVDRPNVMIKVPATPAGIPAIETLIGAGINVNVTLMFSLDHYEAVSGAYLRGLERMVESGGDLSQVASVASFFLSRIDSAVDAKLKALGGDRAPDLLGTIAIANAKVTYQRFLETFSGPRWERLAAQGARVQRVLWASTSTKDPSYPDTMYVDNLIGPDTVNTVPPATLQAFMDHGTVATTVTEGVAESYEHLAALAGLGIDLDKVTEALQKEGVDKFVKPFSSLLDTIREKVARLAREQRALEANLGPYQRQLDEALAEMKSQAIMRRIWDHDHTLWNPDPAEITNRLGWLHSPERMAADTAQIEALVDEVKAAGYSHVLLLGMGGSSLAPEFFAKAFGDDHDGLELAVLDSTDPGAVLAYAAALEPARTLFVVSTKSGGTVETLSFFKYFYNWTAKALGPDAAGAHFVAITDPGSRLADIAHQFGFRAAFLNDPNIGGRYSALSYFGLVPAALAGVDIAALVDRALVTVRNNESCNCPKDGDNLGGKLGAILSELAKAGRDKVTFFTSPKLANFGDWVEQLIAESTGKDGKGILPVVGEPAGPPAVYGDDRLFIHLRLEGDSTHDAALAELAAAGHPLVTLHLRDRYDLGGHFFLWEMATAVAGARMGINPFNQPNVESAKKLARQMVARYQEEGQLPAEDSASPSAEALSEFLSQARTGDYICLQAYLQPTTGTTRALQSLRAALRDRTRLATTLGYGPRFLHSTGQLHKGDAGNGLFIQLVSKGGQDAPIPDEAGQEGSTMSFGVLKAAQALGDAQALRDAGRRVIRFEIEGDAAETVRALL